MNIRSANSSDLPSILEIYNQGIRSRLATCDEDEKSLEDRQVWFKQFDTQYPIFVGIFDNKVVCYGCLFRYSPKSGYRFAAENSLYVHDSYQGRGLGKLMLAHLISAARTCGLKYIEARIFSDNPRSIALHQAAGFKLVGVQPKIGCLDGKFYDNSILYLEIS